MLVFLAMVSAAQAACPPASPADAAAIAETFLKLADSGEPGPWNDRISEPLQFDAILDGAEGAAERLDRVALVKTGAGSRHAEPGFMDVALAGADVVFYLQPDRAVVIDASRHVRIERPRTGTEYSRICANLHEAFEGARSYGLDARIASVVPGAHKAGFAPPAPLPSPRSRAVKPTVRVGLAGQYSVALGPTVEPVVGSAMGGAGYFDVEMTPILGVRLDLRYNREEGIPTEYRGATSTFTTSGFRFSLEGRAQLPTTPFALQGALGPAFGVYTVCGKVGSFTVGCEQVGTELMLGAHASLQGTWTAAGGGLGIFVGPDVEAYVRRTDPEDPVVEIGVRLGVIVGRKSPSQKRTP